MVQIRWPLGLLEQLSLYSYALGLKKAGATYQLAITAIFYNKLHDCLKNYVDNIMVEYKEVHNHVDDLKRVFKTCIQYKLRIDPLNCFQCFFFHNIKERN